MNKKIKFKIPRESADYPEQSAYVLQRIAQIMTQAIAAGNNRIFIHTNLKRGLPLENINKVAGPFVEAWAHEQFEIICDDSQNQYELINVQGGKRLDPFDIILQFKRKQDSSAYVSANIDVKATAEDIATSGKSPNITSYQRIRNEYLLDPDYIFVILSLKHRVYTEKDEAAGMTKGIIEVVSHSEYDLKYISSADLNYNPALGTGQLQIRGIHYVDLEMRTTWEFLKLLDEKYLRSKGKAAWLKLARQNEWIK